MFVATLSAPSLVAVAPVVLTELTHTVLVAREPSSTAVTTTGVAAKAVVQVTDSAEADPAVFFASVRLW